MTNLLESTKNELYAKKCTQNRLSVRIVSNMANHSSFLSKIYERR